MGTQTRRSFLITSFKLGLLITFSNSFKKLFAKTQFFPSWIELIQYARWCPSVHNLQPHKMKIISDTEAELFYDPARLLPVGDPDCIFVTVTMGIFIEHLSIAASRHALKVEMVKMFEPITTSRTGNTLFARLRLVPSTQIESINRELILKRRTSRLRYNGLPLQPVVLNKIELESSKYDHEFFSIKDKEVIKFLIDLNEETLFEDLKSEDNRKELDHLFRYSKHEALTKRDGLWARCMGFSGLLMKSVFREPTGWSKGFKKKMLTNHYRSSFNGTSTIGWFCGHFDSPEEWLVAGKMLARNWLLITNENAYIQPFGSLITNTSAYEKINKKLGNFSEGKKIWMIFRAGYSKEPARSYRLNVDEIVIKS